MRGENVRLGDAPMARIFRRAVFAAVVVVVLSLDSIDGTVYGQEYETVTPSTVTVFTEHYDAACLCARNLTPLDVLDTPSRLLVPCDAAAGDGNINDIVRRSIVDNTGNCITGDDE